MPVAEQPQETAAKSTHTSNQNIITVTQHAYDPCDIAPKYS
jgi:hypothetical protein